MRTMSSRLPARVLTVLCLAASALAVAAAQAPTAPATFAYAEPGISPDGSEIAFASGGDIWTVPAAGGEARLLVADPATERRPLYSPDGRELAFVSDRTGGGDIYVLTFDTGRVRRLTWSDGLDQLDAWSPDGRWIYFSSTSGDIAGMNDVYRVSSTGGTPMVVSGERYTNEFSAAPGPDARFAMVARGISSSQWWRKGSSHIDTSEIWVVEPDAGDTPAYRQLLGGDARARNAWPMWHRPSGDIFYVTDEGGAENLAAVSADGGAPRALTRFTDGRVLWPSMSADGRVIAFEREFGIWILPTTGGEPRQVAIARRGAPASEAPERVRRTSGFTDLALSPDGRKVAFVAHGDVFAASAADGGVAERVTSTPGLESQPVWAPDSRRIAFVADRGEGSQIHVYDFGHRTERALTSGDAVDISPVFSPDGRSVAYLRNRRELRVLDIETADDRVLTTGVLADTVDDPRPAWSPDGRWLAVFVAGTRGFTNVELVPVGEGPRRPVSFLSNRYTNRVAWSPDGTYVLFDTRQRTESGALARVDLTLRTPQFREDLFRDLFETPARPPGSPGEPDRRLAPARPATDEPPATVGAAGAGVAEGATRADPVAPVFAGIRQRLSLLPIGLDVRQAVISPDGKTAVVTAAAAGQTNLYAWPLDELAEGPRVARQITATAGGKADVQFSPDGREVFYLDGGRIRVATVASREGRALDVTAEYTVDPATERLAAFRQAWTLLRDNFFDPAMHGVDWDASHERFLPLVASAANGDEMRRIMSLMIGELNASHLGISGGGGGGSTAGDLGLTFDRREYEANGRLRVTGVVPLGPAALTQDVAVGDVLLAVNGRATGAGVNLDALLADTIDRRVELTFARAAGGDPRTVVVRPASQGTVKGLIYRAWVEANRDHVLKASGGRLGYVHMINMSDAALDQLYIDLDTENHARDGVLIDLRNNNGGFVNGYALDVFARRSYLRMGTRALPEAPARAILGQRALELPTILVTNQHSLSDAEDFIEGYRTLGLGSVVGEPSAGWIIYTWNTTLIDDSRLRLPRMRVKDAAGKDMEMVPRPVDVEVTRPLGESAQAKDSQLDAAIRLLLQQLGRAETPEPGVEGSGGSVTMPIDSTPAPDANIRRKALERAAGGRHRTTRFPRAL